MKKFYFVLFVLASLMTSIAGAADYDKKFEQEFRNRAVKAIRKAQAKGWKKLGEHTLEELIVIVQKPFVVLNPARLKTQVGNRETAMYECSRHVIRVNEESWKLILSHNDEYGDYIAFHETSSAMLNCPGEDSTKFYDDREFQNTLRLEIMGLWDAYENSILHTDKDLQMAGGGGTSGVGGGDGLDYVLKSLAVSNFLVSFIESKKRFNIKKIPSILIFETLFALHFEILKNDKVNAPVTLRQERRRTTAWTTGTSVWIEAGFNPGTVSYVQTSGMYRTLLEAINSITYRAQNMECQNKKFKELFLEKKSWEQVTVEQLIECL